MTSETDRLARSFGHTPVEASEREARIRRVFSAVAPRYDLMNDLMSGGVHRRWKRTLVRLAAPQPGQVIVDLAGGTGDVAARLAGADRSVTVIDPSTEMIGVGRARVLAHVQWQIGSAERMPLSDASVDTLTIAFGIRNVTQLDAALTEILRVLKPGGRFLCLEFSTPAPWLRPAYALYSRWVIPRLGAWVAQSPEAYTYLIESIQRFPDQRRLQGLIEAAGFERVDYVDLSFGIACIHQGSRPHTGRIPQAAQEAHY